MRHSVRRSISRMRYYGRHLGAGGGKTEGVGWGWGQDGNCNAKNVTTMFAEQFVLGLIPNISKRSFEVGPWREERRNGPGTCAYQMCSALFARKVYAGRKRVLLLSTPLGNFGWFGFQHVCTSQLSRQAPVS